jgi:hypothetical protein
MAEEEQKQESEENNPEHREKDEAEDLELHSLVGRVTEANKKRDDYYDEKLRKVEAMKKLIPENEKAEEEHAAKVQLLKEKFSELKARISNARKSGKDPLIADFMSRSIPSKIRMAEITREEKDFEAAKAAIRNATEELEEAEKEVMINVKKEINEKLKMELQKETGKVADEE